MDLFNIIQSKDLKLLSPFIEGGTSKLKKEEKKQLEIVMENYSKSDKEYRFGETKINLDDEQYNVVTAKPNQNIRVLAGAGSGKTTTILCRVKYLVDNFTTPNRILILTFNKDSSENLKNRINKLFGFKINIDIYTIDAFCCLLYHKYDTQKSYISLSEYVLIGRKIMMEYGSEIASKYSYIFFDEFQDVNSKQFDILSCFVNNGCYLTVIGDDAQNIYQFRGSDNYFIINFDNIFSNNKTSTYTLTTNYRSTILITEFANNIIKYNENQVKKIMKTHNEKGFRPKFILSETEDHQIEYIIVKINELIKEGMNLADIAILSRNSYYLKIMETELIKHNIPLVACITDKIGDNIKNVLEPNKVAVTTIHKSKGLEWSHVFILGFCNQHFPSHMNNNIKNIEEERRLFYVGSTRAKKRLYLMATHSEIPISCFINENINLLKIVYNPMSSKSKVSDLFTDKSDETIKFEYSVNDLILLLNTEVIDEMRTHKFIQDFDINMTPLFSSLDLDSQEKIHFTEDIKKGGYEPDFGEFVDRFITRELIIKSDNKYKDNDCMMIINAVILSNSEMELYNKYKINNIVLDSEKNNFEDKDTLNLINKIKKQNQNVVKENTYPPHIIKMLKDSYNMCISNKCSNTILNDVYNVSLCRNFNNDRRRLVYRNVYDLFKTMLNNGIKTNIEKYINIMESHKTTCKEIIFHRFNKTVTLLGEIDIIDWDEETLIDIKCSESDFKLEWYVQLLIYYTFLKDEQRDKIKYFGIINIMNGNYYKIDIPKININNFIEYIKLMIKRDQNNFRLSNNPLKISSLEYKYIPEDISKYNMVYHQKNKKYTIIFDTETSGFYNDVLQLAYVVCDNNGNIIKEVNRYVKNRLPTIESTKIHGIDIKKIKKEGIEFNAVIKEFVENLQECHTIVGHNINYDITTIHNDIRTYGINIIDDKGSPRLNIFKDIEIKDTMTMNGKKIKLGELYLKLFNKNIEGAHNAIYDVYATKQIYFRLKNIVLLL